MTTTTVHDDLIAVMRDFTAHELLPRTEALDTGQPDVRTDVWRRLVALDLDRALLAAHLGGVGLDVDDFLGVLTEIAFGDAGIAVAVLLHNAALLALPAETATGLPAGARWTLALVAGEPAGRLPAVLGAVGADGVVVVTGESAVLAVPAAGLSVQPDPRQMGLRAAAAGELTFDPADAARHIGSEAAAAESGVRALVYAGVAAISRGIGCRAHGIARAYAQTRIQGGVPIIEHGAVSEMLAKMAVRSLAAGPLGAAAGDPAAALAHKIADSDAAMATTLDAVQVLGGIGYMVDTGVEKLMRDAKYCQLFPASNWRLRDELMRLERRSPD